MSFESAAIIKIQIYQDSWRDLLQNDVYAVTKTGRQLF